MWGTGSPAPDDRREEGRLRVGEGAGKLRLVIAEEKLTGREKCRSFCARQLFAPQNLPAEHRNPEIFLFPQNKFLCVLFLNNATSYW